MLMRLDSNSRVIVTGPTGGVGKALIDELLSLGCSVLAVCRPNSERISSLPSDSRVSILELDLCDYRYLADSIDGSYDVMFHLAWAGTSGAARMDWGMQADNVLHAVDAARAATELGCEVFIGVGSQAEYGAIDDVLRPHGLCRPETGYGAAKLAASEMTRAFCRSAGIRHEWCRILSLYGPGDSERSLVMSVIGSLLANEPPKCTLCEQTWDYIYGKDAARALRLVAERGSDGETYLIASGQSRKLKDFVLEIRDLVSPGVEIEFGALPYYPNQAMRLEADISNLVEDTGFVSRYSFKEGISETVNWIVSNNPELKG